MAEQTAYTTPAWPTTAGRAEGPIARPRHPTSRGAGALPRTGGSPVAQPHRILLIEDHRPLSDRLGALLGARPDFTVFNAPADVDAIRRRVRECRPAVVLVDIRLPDGISPTVTAVASAEMPGTGIILIGVSPGQGRLLEHLRAGASAFIMENASVGDLLRTIAEVVAGNKVLPPALTNALFAQLSEDEVVEAPAPTIGTSRLTERERQVMALISAGLGNRAIATQLEIAIHTVKSHVHNLLEKLELTSRLEIAAYGHASLRSSR